MPVAATPQAVAPVMMGLDIFDSLTFERKAIKERLKKKQEEETANSEPKNEETTEDEAKESAEAKEEDKTLNEKETEQKEETARVSFLSLRLGLRLRASAVRSQRLHQQALWCHLSCDLLQRRAIIDALFCHFASLVNQG